MKMIKLCAVAAIALIGCGDNKSNPDAKVADGKMPDAVTFPAAPTLGDQVDRLGRPAVNTVLNHGFDGTAAAQTAKVAYNEASSKTDWLTQANIGQFMGNLGIVDVLDTFCGSGKCDAGETLATCALDCTAANPTGSGNGCGNQGLYNFNTGGSGPPAADSYQVLASILANDELFLDTTISTCHGYLAVEASILIGPTTCGGRAPDYDVIDSSYSMLAMGLSGFDENLEPIIKDGASAHADITATFPYLGPPNTP